MRSPPELLHYALAEVDAALQSAALYSAVPNHRRIPALLFAFDQILRAQPLRNADDYAESILLQHRLIDALSHALSLHRESPSRTHLDHAAASEEIGHAADVLRLALDRVVLNQSIVDYAHDVCLVEGTNDLVRVSYAHNLGDASDVLDHFQATRDVGSLDRHLVSELGDLPSRFRFGNYTVRDFVEMLRYLFRQALGLMRDRQVIGQWNRRRWASRIAPQIGVGRSACESILVDLTFDPKIGKVDVQPLVSYDRDCVLLLGSLLFGINLPVAARRMWAIRYPTDYSRTFGSREFSAPIERKARNAVSGLRGVRVFPKEFRLDLPVPSPTPAGKRASIEIDLLAYDPSGTTVVIGEVFDAVQADTAEEWVGFRAKLNAKVGQVLEVIEALEIPANRQAFADRLGTTNPPGQLIAAIIATGGYSRSNRVTVLTFSSLRRLVDECKDFGKFAGRILIGDVFALPQVKMEDTLQKLDYSGVIAHLGFEIELVADRITSPLERPAP